MRLPSTLKRGNEYFLIGPMGPEFNLLQNNIPTIAIDGGGNFLKKMDLWIGDGDSFNEKPVSETVMKLPIHKNASDLACALSLFTDDLPYRLHLWGFLGGRRDHEFFNLGEALGFLEKLPSAEILFYDQQGNISFRLYGQGQRSFVHHGLFSLGVIKETLISLSGSCDFQLPPKTPLRPLSSFGLSNQGRGQITLESSGPVFLYFPEAS